MFPTNCTTKQLNLTTNFIICRLQIAMPKGVIQDWGLVEFFDPIDTETTQAARNGYPIRGNPIRVHFCIPGVNAINIYMQVNIIE